MKSPIQVASLVATLLLSLSLHDECAGHHDHSSGRILLGAIQPQLSPDGKTVAFAYQGAIWKTPRQGGVMQRLSTRQGFDSRPAWSPSNEKIAFINGRSSHVGPIQIMRSLDGELDDLKQYPIAKNKLAFSPDGRKLLSLFAKQNKFALRWFDIQAGTLSDGLFEDQRGLQYALSPNGQTIALATTHDVNEEQGGNNGPQCDLWIKPAAGGPTKKLMEFPGRVYDVAWTANGEALIVVSNFGGAHNDLWQVPLRDPIRGAKKLTFGQADEDAPSTDSKGRWLAFTDNRRGATSLVIRDLIHARDTVVEVDRRDYGSKTGRLFLEVVDQATEKPTTARVSIRDQKGKYYAPSGALYRMLRGDIHFYCERDAQLALPVGRYSMTIARGPEYVVQRRQFVIEADADSTQQISIRRWTDQRAKHWYSGESHIHANYGYGEWYNTPRTMLAQSAGEDLIVSNFMVANSEADGVFDREFFRGAPDPLSNDESVLYWNQEFRSTIWGHLTLLNLKQLVEPIFTGFARTTHPHDHPMNADIADHTHDQNGHVNYTHPAHNVKDPYLGAYSAKALPLDVALGKVDSMDVMGATSEANMEIWYRLLNCGFRVPASAGTDCFLNRIRSRLPGQVRVYVRVDGEFSYKRWIESLQAGRTFVTDGPMIDANVNGVLAGGEIKLKAPGEVKVIAEVRSQYPLTRVDVICHGKVVYSAQPKQPGLRIAINRNIPVDQSGWIAIRASGPSHADQPTGKLFAHTSPVYIEIQGQPIDAKDEAEYFVAWIDRLRTDVRKRNRIPSRHQVHVESQIAAARAVFNRLLDRSD